MHCYLQVIWSSTGTLVAIIAEESFYILKFERSAYDTRLESAEEITDEGVEEAFAVTAEVPDKSVFDFSLNGTNLFTGDVPPESKPRNGLGSASCILMLPTSSTISWGPSRKP